MNLDWKKIAWAAGILAAVLVLALALRFFFGGSSGTPAPAVGGSLGAGQTNNAAQGGVAQNNAAPPLITTGKTAAVSAVFKIADGPVAGATFVQTLRPTTTVARWVNANDGHAYDLALDSPGAVVQTISNSTIPGVARALWAPGGSKALLQYVTSSLAPTVRTASMQFSASSTALRAAAVIRFLPDNLTAVAISPDGASVAYAKATAAGADGFTAKFDGTGEKKLFSFPLSQISLSWPSAASLLLSTNSAAGEIGAAFSINVKTGGQEEILSAPGLTLSAGPFFSYLLYQSNAGGPTTKAMRLSNGSETPISFSPSPEKCVWGAEPTLVYCAQPLSALPADYLDLWRRGEASAADALLRFDVSTGTSTILAAPSALIGAETPDIAALGVSPDGRYLFFITKHTRTLWGLRLGNSQ